MFWCSARVSPGTCCAFHYVFPVEYCSFLWPPSQDSLGYWIAEFLVELGFWIPIVSGIPDSWSWVPHFKALDSEFQKQKFPEFQIPKAKIFWIPDFTSKNLADSGFHKQKFTGFRNSLSKIAMITQSGLPYTGRIVRFSSRWGSATEMFALVGKTESLYYPQFSDWSNLSSRFINTNPLSLM